MHLHLSHSHWASLWGVLELWILSQGLSVSCWLRAHGPGIWIVCCILVDISGTCFGRGPLCKLLVVFSASSGFPSHSVPPPSFNTGLIWKPYKGTYFIRLYFTTSYRTNTGRELLSSVSLQWMLSACLNVCSTPPCHSGWPDHCCCPGLTHPWSWLFTSSLWLAHDRTSGLFFLL